MISSTNTPQKRLLIIEDERDIRDTLKDFLESEGYDVDSADNGSTALVHLQTHPLPNLILLDMKMPVMNGWEFAAAFLEKYDHDCPIVVMTAAADAEKRAAEIHADGWVGKPFELDDLLGKIRQHEKAV